MNEGPPALGPMAPEFVKKIAHQSCSIWDMQASLDLSQRLAHLTDINSSYTHAIKNITDQISTFDPRINDTQTTLAELGLSFHRLHAGNCGSRGRLFPLFPTKIPRTLSRGCALGILV